MPVTQMIKKNERGVNEMQTPTTMAELRECLAIIMVGCVNNKMDADNCKVALNAATRIIESVQAETRAQALQFAIDVKGGSIKNVTPLGSLKLTAE